MADEQQRLAMRTAAPSSGSRTVTINETQASTSAQGLEQTPSSSTTAGVLHLRGAAGNDARRVAWSEGTVDNEGMGRKKSKICCIYHKPKAFDESSDEASSSADSDDGSDSSASSRSNQSSAASGVNASKALRAKKATAADKAKQAATADSGEPDACTHHHSHGARKARKASSHRSSTRSGGSRNVVVLAPPADSSHKEDGAEGEAEPSKPKPNAYERAPV